MGRSGEGETVKIFGMSIKPDEVQSVTIKRNGAYVTLEKDQSEKSPKIKGFSQKPKDDGDHQ